MLSENWTQYDEVGSQGTQIGLPDSDGDYKNHANWNGATVFYVKSITH